MIPFCRRVQEGERVVKRMAEYLVGLGIDSISLNPDTVVKTMLHVLEVEKSCRVNPISKNR
jgi:phosphoenolpyruvate synthase/pyruvate phosphate dikinase